MEVIVHQEVDNDLIGHIEYYSQNAGSEIAINFYTEFLRCFSTIASRAASFPLYPSRLRRINCDRFPFHILFEVVDDETVFVLVVKHDSLDPDFGLDR